MRTTAICLTSGGLDSAVTLAEAIGRHTADNVLALNIIYGQRHSVESKYAEALAAHFGVEFKQVNINLSAMPSSLVDGAAPADSQYPATFVPGRNILFITYAAGIGYGLHAYNIWTGVNAIDYSGYPDCRPSTIEMLQSTLQLGVHPKIVIWTPLIMKRKTEIVSMAHRLGILPMTWSCYNPKQVGNDFVHCGECDSCRIRATAAAEIGVKPW